MNSAAVNIDMKLSLWNIDLSISFLLDTYPEVKRLDHMADLSLMKYYLSSEVQQDRLHLHPVEIKIYVIKT